MNVLEGGGCFDAAAVASLREHNVPIIVGPMETPTALIMYYVMYNNECDRNAHRQIG